MIRESTRIARCGTALLVFGLWAGTASAQEVGKASAVNPAATANLRTISIGSSIAHKERIKTAGGGSVQLLFLDKTSMTIGPNSDLVIDEYVYDPAAGSGKLAATLSKGALRFVGGQVSHSGDAEIKTADAVIGIRGGVALISQTGSQTNVFAGYGSVTVGSGGTSVTLPAGSYTQTGGGNPPLPPGSPPAGFVSAQLQSFQSSGGQTGGAAPGAASAAAVNRAETNATGSSKGTVAQVAPVSANNAVQVTSTSSSSSSSSSTGSTTGQQLPSGITQTVQTSAQSTSIIQSLPQYPAATFVLNSTNCCVPTDQTSPVPYVPANFATGPGYVSPMLGSRPETPTGSTGPVGALITQFGIGINGVGTAQTSWMFVNEGGFVSNGQGGVTFISGFDAFRLGASSQAIGYANGPLASSPGAVTTGTNLIPTSASVQNQKFDPDTLQYRLDTLDIPKYSLGGDGNPVTSYSISQTLTQGTVPTGLGTYRPAMLLDPTTHIDQRLTAFVGGMMLTYDETDARYLASSIQLTGTGTISLDPNSSRVQANFGVSDVSGIASHPDSMAAASFQFGSLSGSGPRGAYVDYNNFSARAGSDSPVSTVTTQGGAQASLSSRGGFIVAVTPAVQQQIAPALMTPTTSDPTVTFCQCDYTRWGFWASADTRTGTNGHSLTDSGTLMTWVAGQLPGINDVPKSGNATYSGMVVASINNNGNQYVSGGNFSNTVDFGAQTGSVAVKNLDGTDYSGTVRLNPTDPRSFATAITSPLTGTTGGRTMNLNGSFFRGAAAVGNIPAAVTEMGGNVTISGINYLGSGIFAAKAH